MSSSAVDLSLRHPIYVLRLRWTLTRLILDLIRVFSSSFELANLKLYLKSFFALFKRIKFKFVRLLLISRLCNSPSTGRHGLLLVSLLSYAAIALEELENSLVFVEALVFHHLINKANSGYDTLTVSGRLGKSSNEHYFAQPVRVNLPLALDERLTIQGQSGLKVVIKALKLCQGKRYFGVLL